MPTGFHVRFHPSGLPSSAQLHIDTAWAIMKALGTMSGYMLRVVQQNSIVLYDTGNFVTPDGAMWG